MKPNGFLCGNCCPKCAPKVRGQKLSGTISSFKKKVFNAVSDQFSVVSKYINGHTNIKIRHNICGFTFSTNPYKFLERLGCPKCNLKRLKQKLAKTPSECNIYLS